MRNVSEKVVQKIKTRILCSVTFYLQSYRLWDNVGENIVESSWNVMAHGDAREGKWRGNWRMYLVASTLHTTSEHGVSSITTADAQTSAASSRLNWRPSWFKWTRLFRRKTKSGFCACAIKFQTQSTAGQATNDNLARMNCVLGNQGYKHTLIIGNTYCLHTVTMDANESVSPFVCMYIA